ncbi:MAG: hypothetical protein WEC80_02195, partial [Patescibacteria group bacterium]
FHKTEIVLTLPSQSIESTLTIDDIEPAVSTKSSSFTTSKKTTGTAEVGESAKGEVTIHNFDSSEATFEGGTKLIGNGLAYLLDSDTKVASASLTSDGSAKLPGKTKAKITASDIGTDFNISSNNRFTLANLPEADYFAINEEAITGGSKKEVTTVSDEDLEILEENILEKAQELSEKEIDQDFKKKYTIVEQLGGVELSNLIYDKELGDEATTLELKANADITYVGLNDSEVKKRIAESLKDEIEDNFVIENQNITYSVEEATDLGGEYEFDLEVRARASEKVDLSKVREVIVRKHINNISDALEEHYSVNKVELNIMHPLPFLKNWSSIFQRNIDLKVIYD